jgi:hypothetical protein
MGDVEKTKESHNVNGHENGKNGIMSDISNDVNNKPSETKKKKHAKKASIGNGDILDKKLNGLLLGDEEEEQALTT